MDTHIAFILPGHSLVETTKKSLAAMNREYPLYCSDEDDAVKIAKNLEKKNIKIIISSGSTCQTLQKNCNILVIEMQYSVSECAEAIRRALQYSDSPAIIGSKYLCEPMQKAVQLLNKDISIFLVKPNESVEKITYDVINQGYKVIVSGNPAVQIARNSGIIGIGINMDASTVELTLRYANHILYLMEQVESKYEMIHTILNTINEGIVCTDQYGRVIFYNSAALSTLEVQSYELEGQLFSNLLKERNIINILNSDFISQSSSNSHNVTIRSLPVYVNNLFAGDVMTIQSIDAIQSIENSIRKNLAQRGLIAKKSFADIIGNTKIMQQTIAKAKKYANYNSTVLILGETGTGKEIFAQSIHNASKRKNKPFVAVNCASIPETLLESHLFGYVKGAFTGASNEGHIGLFETAHKGTIFLDEISEISTNMQASILRVLQEKEITRIGDTKIIPVDVRVIASSNKDLQAMVRDGKFREDLYYRLAVLELELPPLRKRSEDIPLIAKQLIYQYNKQLNTNITGLTQSLAKAMMSYSWPGNIRQLGNVIEQMMVLSDSNELDIPLPYNIMKQSDRYNSVSLIDAERQLIEEALVMTKGNKKEAAHLLGINPSTLWRKLKSMQSSSLNNEEVTTH